MGYVYWAVYAVCSYLMLNVLVEYTEVVKRWCWPKAMAGWMGWLVLCLLGAIGVEALMSMIFMK